MEYVLSFDIAKGKSVYCFLDFSRNIIINPKSINHFKDEFVETMTEQNIKLFGCLSRNVLFC